MKLLNRVIEKLREFGCQRGSPTVTPDSEFQIPHSDSMRETDLEKLGLRKITTARVKTDT